VGDAPGVPLAAGVPLVPAAAAAEPLGVPVAPAGAVRGLTDERLPEEEERTIRSVLDDHADNFIEYHDLRTRHVGGRHAVDLHLVVPSALSVAAAHDLSTHLEDEIGDALPQTDIVIHIEPEDEAVQRSPTDRVRPPDSNAH
jgi:divalent metal cation (Fe/Co/Zn/Cd) transporter